MKKFGNCKLLSSFKKYELLFIRKLFAIQYNFKWNNFEEQIKLFDMIMKILENIE
jgi:hypothetical protein